MGRCLVLFALKIGRYGADLTFLRPFSAIRVVGLLDFLDGVCKRDEGSKFATIDRKDAKGAATVTRVSHSRMSRSWQGRLLPPYHLPP